jgi:hypothetical protein
VNGVAKDHHENVDRNGVSSNSRSLCLVITGVFSVCVLSFLV